MVQAAGATSDDELLPGGGEIVKPAEDEFDSLSPPSDRKFWTWVIALSSSTAYCLSYFWRYPVFMLPDDVLDARVVTIFHKDLNLHACFSLAFMLGFGAAKMPASCFAASHFFFAHRFASIAAILVGSMLIECLGLLAAASPATQVAAVFLS